jgi:hypothetical protein
MVARLQVASPRPQVLLAKWTAARRAASSKVEAASTEAEAEAQADGVKALKPIDQLS